MARRCVIHACVNMLKITYCVHCAVSLSNTILYISVVFYLHVSLRRQPKKEHWHPRVCRVSAVPRSSTWVHCSALCWIPNTFQCSFWISLKGLKRCLSWHHTCQKSMKAWGRVHRTHVNTQVWWSIPVISALGRMILGDRWPAGLPKWVNSRFCDIPHLRTLGRECFF